MRFVFTPPADHAAGLLTLPWREPLEEWRDERLVEIRQRGISRHVVRFVDEGGVVYALKELMSALPARNTSCCGGLPSWACRPSRWSVSSSTWWPPPADRDAVLVTKFLGYSTSYRALFLNPRGRGHRQAA